MRYFSVIFFVCLVILVMLFHNCGYAFLKYSKYNTVRFNVSDGLNNNLLLKCLWSCNVGCGTCGDYVNLYPECNSSSIFVVDHYGVVKRLNFNTGQCVWSKTLSNLVFNTGSVRYSSFPLLSGGVSISDRYLYFGSELAKVYALDINTGAVLWVSEVSGEVISKPVISHGLVLVYTSNGVFQALDVKNGIIRWSVSFKLPDFSFRMTLLPIIHDNTVILGDSGGTVSACCIDTGELIWQRNISSIKGITDLDRLSNVVTLVVADNVIYSVAYNGNMVALDIFSGNVIWSKNIGSLTNIIVQNDYVYVVDQDSRVIMLNKVDGNVIWSKSDLIYQKLITMVLYKNYILLGDENGYLYCFYKKDGSFFGKQKVVGDCFNFIAIEHNKIIFYENSGKLSVWCFVNDSV